MAADLAILAELCHMLSLNWENRAASNAADGGPIWPMAAHLAELSLAHGGSFGGA